MSAVAYSIGKASRDDATVSKSQRANPGPGAYVAQGTRYKQSPAYGIGSAKRQDLGNSQSKFVPGPSVYNLKSKVGEGPAFFMGEKTGGGAMAGNRSNPGPGAYTPGRVNGVDPSYTMGSKTKFGMTIAVQPETGSHTKIASSCDLTPGAGTYHPKAVYRNVHTGPKFGSDSRKGMSFNGHSPGPNAYRVDNKTQIQKSAPAYGFGTSKRPQTANPKQLKPGPGAYELRGIVGTESQGRTLASKLMNSATVKNLAPGPGAYTPMFSQAIKTQPGWRIGTSKRGEEERAERKRNYPPPDSYDPNISASKNKAATWGFGTSVRDDFAKGNKNPGPNNYNVYHKKGAPVYGMGLKLDNQSLIGTSIRKTAANPSAANYHPDYRPTKKQLPAFSMKGRHRNAEQNKVPGPGAYNQVGSPTKKAAPSYGFGTAGQRGKLQMSLAPGPGVYQLPTSIGNLPEYTGARSKMAYV